jgi:hypothetical protein
MERRGKSCSVSRLWSTPWRKAQPVRRCVFGQRNHWPTSDFLVTRLARRRTKMRKWQIQGTVEVGMDSKTEPSHLNHLASYLILAALHKPTPSRGSRSGFYYVTAYPAESLNKPMYIQLDSQYDYVYVCHVCRTPSYKRPPNVASAKPNRLPP